MIKSELKAIAGFENEFAHINERIANLELEIEEAKALAVAEVEARFEVTKNRLAKILAEVSEQVDVEVEEEPAVEEASENEEPVYTEESAGV